MFPVQDMRAQVCSSHSLPSLKFLLPLPRSKQGAGAGSAPGKAGSFGILVCRRKDSGQDAGGGSLAYSMWGGKAYLAETPEEQATHPQVRAAGSAGQDETNLRGKCSVQ